MKNEDKLEQRVKELLAGAGVDFKRWQGNTTPVRSGLYPGAIRGYRNRHLEEVKSAGPFSVAKVDLWIERGDYMAECSTYLLVHRPTGIVEKLMDVDPWVRGRSRIGTLSVEEVEQSTIITGTVELLEREGGDSPSYRVREVLPYKREFRSGPHFAETKEELKKKLNETIRLEYVL